MFQVRWSPPPPQHHNGHLLGYKIQVSYIFWISNAYEHKAQIDFVCFWFPNNINPFESILVFSNILSIFFFFDFTLDNFYLCEITQVFIYLIRHIIFRTFVSNYFQVKAGNSSKVLAQMTLNATTMSVMLNNLTTGATYNVRVVAYTRVGAGPYSQPVIEPQC